MYDLYFHKFNVGGIASGSDVILGSILALLAAITQSLFFTLIRYKCATGASVNNTDILCYNIVAALAVCVGKTKLLIIGIN